MIPGRFRGRGTEAFQAPVTGPRRAWHARCSRRGSRACRCRSRCALCAWAAGGRTHLQNAAAGRRRWGCRARPLCRRSTPARRAGAAPWLALGREERRARTLHGRCPRSQVKHTPYPARVRAAAGTRPVRRPVRPECRLNPKVIHSFKYFLSSFF